MISIIVPTRNLFRKKNLKAFYKSMTSLPDLVSSIRKNVSCPCEIVVVVNGQADQELIDFVKREKIDKWVINNLNVGVSRAWNIGRQMAEGDHLLFVNDDVTLGKNSVETLSEYLTQHPDVGVVGPKGAMWKNGEHERFAGMTQIEEADAIAGFCFMTTAQAFDSVGGIDIAYTPAGMEEIDYCFMLKKAGLKRVVIPNLDIVTEPAHGISAQNTTIEYLTSKVSTTDLHARNKKYFCKKWNI